MIWLERKPEKPELQHCRLQMSGQSCQCPLNLGAEQKARKSSSQLQAPRNPVQEPACAGKGTHGANSHISPVENGAGAANRLLRIPSSLLFPHLFWLHLAPGTQVMSPARSGPLELSAGATNTAQHRQFGTWGHEESPPSLSEQCQGTQPRHFRGIRACKGIEMHLFHGRRKDFTFLQPGESWTLG